MASEIRVDKINSLSGVGTVTLSPTGVDIAGITTAATLRATTGIVTSLTAGSLTSLGAVSGTTGTFSGAVSGTTGTFSAAVSGTTGTFTGDVDIADKIVHTGDTNTAIRFPSADTITAETGGSERVRIDSSGRLLIGSTAKAGDSALQVYTSDQLHPAIRVHSPNSNGFTLFGDAYQTDETQINFGISYSSASLVISQGCKVSTSSDDAYVSSQDSYSTKPNVFRVDTDGSFSFLNTNTSATTTTDSAVSLTERMRLTSSGDLGLGTANPSDNIHISESGATNNYIRFSNSNVSNGWSVGAQSGGRFQIVQNGVADRFFIESDGNVTVNSGNLIIGTSGKGIDFSAGADSASTSNLLDEYEEGEYTPALSSGQTLNSSYDRLRYTKIGRQVSITGQLVFGAYNSGSFSSTFTIGLPFNNGDGGDRSEYLYHAGIGYFNPTGSSSPSSGYQAIGFYAAANSSHVSVFAINPNTDTTIGNWVGSGSDVWVNLTYFTD